MIDYMMCMVSGFMGSGKIVFVVMVVLVSEFSYVKVVKSDIVIVNASGGFGFIDDVFIVVFKVLFEDVFKFMLSCLVVDFVEMFVGVVSADGSEFFNVAYSKAFVTFSVLL